MNFKMNLRINMGLSVLIAVLLVTPLLLQAAENEKLIEHETGFYYTIQKGDTLWDLSRKFSDSAWLWPEMWQENKQIANPHRIYPGERIRLLRRTGTQKIAEKKMAVIPPALEDLIHYDYAALDRVGFIRKEPVAAHGTIFKVMETKEMINMDDIVYIRPEGDFKLSLGKRYTIYRTLLPIKDRFTNEYIGIQHYILGTVEITQLEPEYAVGRVIKAFGRMQKDDLLMPYERQPVTITKSTPPPGIVGEVIMAEEHNQILGDNIVAFINRGANDGVKTGHIFDIYFQDEVDIYPQQAEKTLLKPVVFGQLVVLRTEATTATVYITQTKQAIHPGTKFASPKL